MAEIAGIDIWGLIPRSLLREQIDAIVVKWVYTFIKATMFLFYYPKAPLRM
jgi:hypothetical protein